MKHIHANHLNYRIPRGFTLIISILMMVLLSLLAIGLLGLSSVSLRAASQGEARAIAHANARLGLMLALGQLQAELGDDRRITADAAILPDTRRPSAVGVWNGWSPRLGATGGLTGSGGVDYRTPKGPEGFRRWLVSDPNPAATKALDWHKSESGDGYPLFTADESGFDLTAGRIFLEDSDSPGSLAWAVTQENTKARINIGTDEDRRPDREDRMQTPSRPNLSLSDRLSQPEDNWPRRPALIASLAQVALDPGYSVTPAEAASAHFTPDSLSVLSNPVDGGLKVDLSTGFELDDNAFSMDRWNDSFGQVTNPFRSDAHARYKGQRPLFNPLTSDSQAQVFMNFPPASVNHKFQVNGVPTFDTLRAHYRIPHHLYASNGGAPTVFERPYSHVSTPSQARDRPFGVKSQPSLAPVLDRMNLFFSIFAKSDGTLAILLSPVITLWNPHNIALETEGVVVYPWIDFAVFWNWSVTTQAGVNHNWSSSLSALVGEGDLFNLSDVFHISCFSHYSLVNL
jgi:type II secretory pathway pseudopilin PulG